MCLDIDGTLLQYDGTMHDATRDAVRNTVAAGHHVVLSTGRAVVATTPILRMLDLDRGYVVCSNGAVVMRRTGDGWERWRMQDDALAALAAKGVDRTEVTLHVGAGTFLPVKVEDVATHRMHAEWGEVTEAAAAQINATRAAGGRIIPVGTTALRLIESAASPDGVMHPWRGPTDIFIYPGYRFRVTDALMTNFHLPKSTLLMLVSALMGADRMRRVYAHAVRTGYRFFSYGDASLLVPDRV